jgi:hypothetical protein
MEERFKLLETIREGTVMGRVWKVSYFDSAGADMGTVYEVELSTRASGLFTFRCDPVELKNCILVLERANRFIQSRKDEYPVGPVTQKVNALV